jgi:(p)ppGpp synthase/HD superfamily hydrolase
METRKSSHRYDGVFLTDKFDDALVFAHTLHRRQKRKGTRIPYISHLLAVASLVIENGGDEEQAIAALLHDAVEDQGGIETLEMIRVRFGRRVSRIVKDCSDAWVLPKPEWRKRKEDHLAHLQHAPADSLLVSLGDKVHNALAIRRDRDEFGEAVWSRFNGGKEGTLWYYRSLSDCFSDRLPGPLANELGRIVEELEADEP